MKFVFIDEIEQQQKNPNFFGLGVFVVDSFFYPTLHSQFQAHFKKSGWNKNIEFKGRYLFSKKADDSIDIDTRIELVENMAQDSVACKNSRCRFSFFYNFKKKTKTNYLDLVSHGINSLDKTPKVGGKNQVIIYYDDTELISPQELSEIIEPFLKNRGLLQVELPSNVRANYKTIGIIYTDVLSYLKSWIVLHAEVTEEQEKELFGLGAGARDTQKLEKINSILGKLKSVHTKKIS